LLNQFIVDAISTRRINVELNIPLGDILFTSSCRIDAIDANTAHVIGVGDITAIPHLFRLTKRRDWLKQDEDSLWKVLYALLITLICMH
jgi:hypothetical protein